MSNKDFIKFMNEAEGYLNAPPLKVNLKLDGCLVSFGMDEDGRIWLKSGKSKKIYDEGAFWKYTQSKIAFDRNSEDNQKRLKRASDYDYFLGYLKKNEIGLKPGDFVVGELFNRFGAVLSCGTGMASRLKFVHLEYLASEFPKHYTIYIYNTNTNLESKIFDTIEFRDPCIWVGFQHLSEDLMNIWKTFKKDLSASRLTKHASWILKKIKEDISKEIYKYHVKQASKLGACEGIVIMPVPENGKMWKIINPSFREMVKKS